MSDHKDMHFNADKIFIYLFAFTAAEVAWGYALKDAGRIMLWGGLLFFAVLKAYYIAVYFMHLKFEGWIVKGLILPTPFLVLVIMGYVMPDVADKDGNLAHPVGAQLNPETGEVLDDLSDPRWGTSKGDTHGADAGGH